MREHLVAEVDTLLHTSPKKVVRWKGTMLDLIEAVHTAYTTGLLRDEWGNPRLFKVVAARACVCVGHKRYKNAAVMAASARRRKGLRSFPFMTRYTYMLSKNPNATPLLDMLETKHENLP